MASLIVENMADLSLVDLDVSRETLERLDVFCARLEHWSAAINLIAPAPRETLWRRHIVDSAQLFNLRQHGETWSDLGSGGGLPAIVIAIIAHEVAPDLRFHMVESDSRKAAFLRIISAELSLNAQVHQARAERLPPLQSHTVSARALAPLEKLLGYVHRHLDPSGVALLPKGRNHASEIDAARKLWSFDLDLVDSVAEEGAKILRVSQIQRNAGSA